MEAEGKEVGHGWGLVEKFEVGWGDEGEGYGGDVFELDDDVAVFVDTFDGAFDAGEVAFGDDDATTDFVGYGCIVEEDDTVIGDGGDSDEVLHLMVGHLDDFGTNRRVEWAGHHVAEWTDVLFGHFERGECFASRVDEEEVVDGGDEFEASVSAAGDELVLDGEEGLDVELVEACLHFQFAIVGDAHGKPAEGGSVFDGVASAPDGG